MHYRPLPFALFALACSAAAQSQATGAGWISYQLTPAAGSDLAISDGGSVLLNLVNASPSQYTYTSGTGQVSALIDPATYYSNAYLDGYAGVGDDASVPSGPGVAVASSGTEQTILLTNSGSSDTVLGISAFASPAVLEGVSGPVSASDYATTEQFMGFTATDTTTSSRLDFDYVEAVNASSGPSGYYYTSAWSNPYSNFFVGSYSVSVAAGHTVDLSFFSVGESSAALAVPGPGGFLALGIGMVGLLSRRRR